MLDIHRLLRSGADKVAINTAAIERPEFICDASQKFGSQCVVVAIDAKLRQNGKGWEVFTHGGRNQTGLDAIEWASKVAAYGAGEILLTSMDADGTKNGYDIELTRAISRSVEIPIIASGGVGNLEHMYVGLVDGEADAALAASIFHFQEYTVGDAKEYLKGRGVSVRDPASHS